MPKATKESQKETILPETDKKENRQTESIYTVEEFANNALNLFNVRSECVMAALKMANVHSCTISRAKQIVNEFITKEVK